MSQRSATVSLSITSRVRKGEQEKSERRSNKSTSTVKILFFFSLERIFKSSLFFFFFFSSLFPFPCLHYRLPTCCACLSLCLIPSICIATSVSSFVRISRTGLSRRRRGDLSLAYISNDFSPCEWWRRQSKSPGSESLSFLWARAWQQGWGAAGCAAVCCLIAADKFRKRSESCTTSFIPRGTSCYGNN